MKERRKPQTPEDCRSRMVIRQWRLLIALRERARSLDELAKRLKVSSRTIRRDLAALQAVPFPIRKTGTDDSGLWRLMDMQEWQRREQTPRYELGNVPLMERDA